MIRFILSLFVLLFLGIITLRYKQPEDKTQWYFADHNPFIMLQLGDSVNKSYPFAPSLLPKVGDKIVIRSPVELQRIHQLEVSITACVLPVGSQLEIQEVDSRDEVLVHVSVRDKNEDGTCEASDYTMYTSEFFFLHTSQQE
jgi:hypothetical protein